MDITAIESEQFCFVHLDVADLRALADGNKTDAVRSGALNDPYDVLCGDAFLCDLRATQIEADPGVAPWLLRFIVERATSTIVGSINFHGAPDQRGMVEIGLTIAEPFRRSGIGRHAVSAMGGYAAAHRATVLRATISPTNDASLALFTGLGFVHVGEQVDEIDGLELIYEHPLPLHQLDVSVTWN